MGTRRGDIEGLRALAVGLVIADHLGGWPTGGFIGVDVFFVISGFLITGLLLKEHARTGRISFPNFYRRRAKRILPAALLVTLVSLVLAFSVFTRSRFDGLLTDAVWATVFASNWRFIATGTDYLHADNAVSLFQHYWSLSIEEQFYFVWPVVLVVALTLGTARHARRGAALTIATIGAASFLFALWQTATFPTVAYFSTFSRLWELAAGAGLALASTRLHSIPDKLRPLIAWAGLCAISVGALSITSETPFPGPFALVPILGTAAVIAAGTGGQQRFLWPLRNRAVGYVGSISYSLYLWHLPVIVFSGVFITGSPRRFQAVALLATVVLAIVTYHWVENPIRFRSGAVRLLRPGLAFACILAVLLAAVNVAPPSSEAVAQEPVPREQPTAARVALWDGIDTALTAKTWPRLTPAIDTIGAADVAPEWVTDGCLGNASNALVDLIAKAERCHFGNEDAEKIAVVFGDSIAISWVPGIRAALEPLGYRIDVITAQQCPSADVPTLYGDGSAMPTCAPLRDWAISEALRTNPDLVIMSNTPGTLERLDSGTTGSSTSADWEVGMRSTVAALAESRARVVLLQAPPTSHGFDSCATLRSTPAQCLLNRSADYSAMNHADEAALADSEAHYVSTTSWFCSAEGLCPSFVGSTPVLADGNHLTAAYATSLAPVLLDELASR